MGTCACCHMFPRFPLSDHTWVSMARLFRTRTSRFKEPVGEKPGTGDTGHAGSPAQWADPRRSSFSWVDLRVPLAIFQPPGLSKGGYRL